MKIDLPTIPKKNIYFAALLISIFAATITVQFLQYYQADWGKKLLSPYPNSDAFLFHYKAWYIAFINEDGGFLKGIVPDTPYIWLLSSLFKLFGSDYKIIFLANMVLAGFTSFFCFLTAYKIFDLKTAFFSGLIIGLYGPFVFYAGLSHKLCLTLLLFSSAGYFAILYFSSKKFYYLFLSTFIYSFSCLIRNNAAVIVFFLLIMAFVPYFRKKQNLLLIKTLLASLSAVLFVFFISPYKGNSIEPDFFSPFGLNIYFGNSPGSDGGYREFKNNIRNNLIGHAIDAKKYVEAKTGKSMTKAELSRYWIKQTFNYLKEQPISFIALQLRKAAIMFSHMTYGDPEEYRVWRWERPALIVAFIDYGLFMSLVFMGLFFLKDRIKEPALFFIVGSSAVYILSILIFHVNERYRLPFVPILVPIAGYAVTKIINQNLTNKLKYLSAVFVLCLATMGLSTFNAHGPGWELNQDKKRTKELNSNKKLLREYIAREDATTSNRYDDWTLLADIYSKRRFYPDAINFANRAISISPSSIKAYYVLYNAYNSNKDVKGLSSLINDLEKIEKNTDHNRKQFQRLKAQAITALDRAEKYSKNY